MSEKIGLVLAAGGAKGAYQAGSLLCFAEKGIKFSGVSGTSVGTINGAYYVQGDGSSAHIEGLVRFWAQLPKSGIIKINAGGFTKAAAVIFSLGLPTVSKIIRELSPDSLSFLDPQPLIQLLDEFIDYDMVRSSSIPLFISLLPSFGPISDVLAGSIQNADYYLASQFSAEELRAALLAATAFPAAFPSRTVRGKDYSDAGLSDPVPAKILLNNGFKFITSIFLGEDTPQNRADFGDAKIFHLHPSKKIDHFLSSTFDFSQKTIDHLIELGYRDTKASYGDCAKWFEILHTWERSKATRDEMVVKIPRRRLLI